MGRRKKAAEAVAEQAPADASVLVCQCGGMRFREVRRTKKAVIVSCADCSTKTSVQGRITMNTVDRDFDGAITMHIKPNTLVEPLGADPEADVTDVLADAAADQTGAAPRTADPDPLTFLRFRVRRSARDAIYRILKIHRVQHLDEGDMLMREWMGYALEQILADYAAGADPRAAMVVDAMDDAVVAAEAHFRAKHNVGEDREIPKRTRNYLHRKVMGDLAGKLGLVRSAPQASVEGDPGKIIADAIGVASIPEPVLPTPAVLQDPEEEEDMSDLGDIDEMLGQPEEQVRIPDRGRLKRAVAEDLADYADGYEKRKGHKLAAGIADARRFDLLLDSWQTNGGYLFRILGDPRTMTPEGERPEIFVWLLEEDDDMALEIGLAYEDAITEIPNLELDIVELLPDGYYETPADKQWEKPACATRREILTGGTTP